MCKYNHCPSCCDMFVLAEAQHIIRLNSTGFGWRADPEQRGQVTYWLQTIFLPASKTIVPPSFVIRLRRGAVGEYVFCLLCYKEEREGCFVLKKEAKVGFLYFCWILLHEQSHLSKHNEEWKWNKGERGRNYEKMDWSKQGLKTVCEMSDCSSFYSCWTFCFGPNLICLCVY